MLDENEVRARLEQAGIPNVDHFEVTTGPDHTGAEAAFIYAVIPDEIAELEYFSAFTRAIDNRIIDVFKIEFPGIWPYVSFRSVSETIERVAPPSTTIKQPIRSTESMFDADEIRVRLESLAIANVDHFDVEIRLDSAGQESAFIYAVVPDSVVRDNTFVEEFRHIHEAIFNFMDNAYPGHWHYVRFRSVSDMASMRP